MSALSYQARFRRRRNRKLSQLIDELYAAKGATIDVLDVGGAPWFWTTVESRAKCQLKLINLAEPTDPGSWADSSIDYTRLIGDARDLTAFENGAYDLVVSNSVIEHVGGWPDVVRACGEMRRVGRNGWVQTPAFACPVEPHFMLPFIHWFGAPIRRRLLEVFGWRAWHRGLDLDNCRRAVEEINLFTSRELRSLFEGAMILTERVALLPKSYIAVWRDGPKLTKRR